MDFTHISISDFKAFSEKYPTAYAFLLKASLKGELDALRVEIDSMAHYDWLRPERRDWVRGRIAELETLNLK